MKTWLDYQRRYPLPENAVKLVLSHSFPQEESIREEDLLFNPISFDHDGISRLFIADQGLSQIIGFNSDGEKQSRFGRKGQGPSEFSSLGRIRLSGGKIMVLDTMKRAILFFSHDGRYEKSIGFRKSYYDFYNETGFGILGVPYLTDPHGRLIDVLSESGDVMRSFGEPMAFQGRHLLAMNRVALDVSPAGDIVLAFHYLPRVRLYASSGELRREIQLEHSVMKFKESLTRERIKSSSGQFGYVNVIGQVRAKEGGFYCLHVAPRLEILEYDDRGRLLTDYWAAPSFDYVASDFLVVKEGRTTTFFVLQTSPEKRVDVFVPER